MGQGLELYVWLGAAGIGLSSAQLLLWRARRALRQVRQYPDVADDRVVPTAAVTQPTTTVTAT